MVLFLLGARGAVHRGPSVAIKDQSAVDGKRKRIATASRVIALGMDEKGRGLAGLERKRG
jgi:hypothetical protein